jgi:GT2 family glycosyltransferase
MMKKDTQKEINIFNITFVLAVLNKLDLTKDCYTHLRKLYPEAPLVISSGGSSDGTKEWLESLDDDYLSYIHDDDRLTFSETYNAGIKLVDTDKLVLIHNDMIIGEQFLENLDKLLDNNPNTLLSYTTIEPPIFKDHKRPGKVIMDLGTSFHNFNYSEFNTYVKNNNVVCNLYDGAVFFMSGFKKMFEDIGGFDGFSFVPCFCEDDDFLIRAKIKGYNLKTTDGAITYHFVSQTSRFSDDYKNNRILYEINSNRNFIRKWGIPISSFNELRYWEEESFKYNTFSIGLTTTNRNRLYDVEPFFDKIDLGAIPEDYILNEQKNTRYDLRSKFTLPETVDVMIYETSPFTDEDIYTLHRLRLSIPYYETGQYNIGNMTIEIKKGL